MARISTYQQDLLPTVDDRVIGSDSDANDVTRNYKIGDIVALKEISSTVVLSASSFNAQVPVGLDTPLQVEFGPAQNTVTDDVMISSDGIITFNKVGTYLFNGYGNIERQGSSGGVAIFLFRALIEGVQVGNTKTVHLAQTGISTPYEVTIPIYIENAGTKMIWQVMQSSSGVDEGGLYPHPVAGGIWSDVPSASLLIFKLQ